MAVNSIQVKRFLAFAANEGLDKQQVIEMINSHYDQFTGDDDSSLFKRL